MGIYDLMSGGADILHPLPQRRRNTPDVLLTRTQTQVYYSLYRLISSHLRSHSIPLLVIVERMIESLLDIWHDMLVFLAAFFKCFIVAWPANQTGQNAESVN